MAERAQSLLGGSSANSKLSASRCPVASVPPLFSCRLQLPVPLGLNLLLMPDGVDDFHLIDLPSVSQDSAVGRRQFVLNSGPMCEPPRCERPRRHGFSDRDKRQN